MGRTVSGNGWRVTLCFAILSLVTPGLSLPVKRKLTSQCPEAFFNFGTSLTDTGNLLNALPFSPTITNFGDPENPPYGDTFFFRPAKRYSNGRLIPDFISLAFQVPLLDTYFAPTVFNFKHGVNFAMDRPGVSNDHLGSPVLLPLQLKQFIRFKSIAQTAASQRECLSSIPLLPQRTGSPNDLYTLEFGSSDIRSALHGALSTGSITSSIIPAIMQSIVNAVKLLYQYDARRFLIYNVYPQGCSPQILTLFVEKDVPRDDLGCIIEVNELDEAFNKELSLTVQDLRASLPEATIILFDFYNASNQILRFPTKYACCGASGVGTYNYHPNVTCGVPGFNKCADPDRQISWDGVHFTDSFYRIISEFILNGEYTTPNINFTKDCTLNITTFPATYEEVYGGLCSVWYP